MLSTGIDVEEICNIVFVRRIKSRILYDQMIGRATRRCDEIGKEVFKIYDCVGVTEIMAKENAKKRAKTNLARAEQLRILCLERRNNGWYCQYCQK